MKNRIKSLQIRLLVAFILSSVFVVFLYNYLIAKQQYEYVSDTTDTYSKAYNTVYNQYKQMSSLIFSGLIQLTDAKNLFQNLENIDKKEQDIIRKEIYQNVLFRYKTLKQKHIKSINFILADNTMFLKMNDPNHHGTKVSKKRHLIFHVQKNHTYIDSYELGRFGEGFKFLYPIMDKNKYLGLIEITFGAESITSTLMEQYSVLSNFHIHTKNFNMELLKTKEKFYKMSENHKYVLDKRVLKVLKKYANELKFEDIQPPKKSRKKIAKHLDTKIIKSIYDRYTMNIYTVIPVQHKLTKVTEAFFVVRSKHSALNLIHENYFLVLGIILFILFLVFYIAYQQSTKAIYTQEKLKEEKEREKQLLEKSKHASMGEMIGNIAHQWRQPLTVISTASTGVLLYKDLGTLTNEQIDKEMNIINDNAQYLSRTIDTFRNFLKEDKETREVIIKERIETALNIISATIKNHDITLKQDLSSQNLRKTMPVGELPQVIINIVNNAKDILVEKNIQEPWIEVKLFTQDDQIMITIEDNGGGIPQKIISRIFEPYFTTKHQSKGTGLGLHMSYKIIAESLGGDLKVTNTDVGAKFIISIPL